MVFGCASFTMLTMLTWHNANNDNLVNKNSLAHCISEML